MIIELLATLNPNYGLRAGVQLEVYEGFGAECGTTDSQGNPTGAVWVRCPQVPVVRNRSGEVVNWKSAYRILERHEFAVVGATNIEAAPARGRFEGRGETDYETDNFD